MIKKLLNISIFVLACEWANAQTWEPLGPSKFDHASYERVDFTNIVVGPEGTPYLAYNGVDGYIIRKFNGSVWETMETFQATDLNLIKDSLGTLYIAYSDKENGFKATVRKFNGTTWELVGMAGFSKDYANSIKMVFDPGGTPFVVFTTGTGSKVAVMKFNGTTWVAVGNAGISKEQAFAPTMAIGPDGTPYVAYKDLANEYKGTVIRFNGTNWETVGDAGFTSPNVEPQIVIDQENIPYIAYADTENDSRARVMKFNGSTWETVGSGVISENVAIPIIATDPAGALYVAYQDGSFSGKVTVMKFNGNTWELVGIAGDTWSNNLVRNISMGFDSTGTPYIAYSDEGLGGRVSVKKFNGSTWERIAPLGILGTSSGKHSMALDATGTPYVAFSDAANDRNVTVRRFIGNHWETVGNEGFTEDGVVSVRIAIDSAGTPYVVFADSRNNHRLTVKKFNGTSWETVGNAGFSAVATFSFSLAIGPGGKPYVAITDRQSKLVVMMFNGNDWELISTQGIPEDVGTNPSIAFDSHDTLYVAYPSTASYGKANAYKFNGTHWNRVGNANFSNDGANEIKIIIDAQGTPYALCDDNNTAKATVKRFNGSTWEDVGQLDPRSTYLRVEPYFPDMALDRYGTPYVTYGGDIEGNKTMVKKFNGEQWETVGNPDFTASQSSFPIISIDDKGTIYLVYKDADLYAFKYESGDVNPTAREFIQPTVKAWPNPFSEKVTIEFSSPLNTLTRLEIYDAKGSMQKVLFDSSVKVGQLYQWEYVPLQKSNAILFYRLTLGDQVFSGKLIHLERK